MPRPSDMTERQLEDAIRSIDGATAFRPLSARTRALLERHRERLCDQLSLRQEDRWDIEEQRRVDAYLDEGRGA